MSSQISRSLLMPHLGRNPITRRAAFHSALGVRSQPTQSKQAPSSFTYVPGGPIWKDGPNDPTPFPAPSKSHGSYHWSFERLLSAALIPLTTAAFLTSPAGSTQAALDGVLGISLIIHSHIGFDACVVDYLPQRKFPVIGSISKWGLRFLTGGALVGLYEFNTQDVGLTELVRQPWLAKKSE